MAWINPSPTAMGKVVKNRRGSSIISLPTYNQSESNPVATYLPTQILPKHQQKEKKHDLCGTWFQIGPPPPPKNNGCRYGILPRPSTFLSSLINNNCGHERVTYPYLHTHPASSTENNCSRLFIPSFFKHLPPMCVAWWRGGMGLGV
jgi:hypothetical protein